MNKEHISLREGLSIIRKSIKLGLNVKSPSSLACSIVGIVFAFLPVLISKVLEIFSNNVQHLHGSNIYYLRNTIIIFVILALLYILQIGYQTIQSFYSQIDTLKVMKSVKQCIIDNICAVDYKYVNNTDGYIELVGLADTISGTKVAGTIQKTTAWLSYLISFISTMYVLLSVNPWIVVVLILATVPTVLISYFQNDETFRFNTRQIKEGQLLMHNFTEMVGPTEMTEIRYLGILDYLKSQWLKSASVYMNKKKLLTRKHVALNSIGDILRNGVYILIILITVREIYLHPEIGIGSFMLVFTLSSQLQNITAELFSSIIGFFDDLFYLKLFFDLDKYKHNEEKPTPVSTQNGSEIIFDNVSFTYPGKDVKAIDSICFRINPGEKIAIVGENGSGKTTLVNLLCGFFQPDEGSIFIDKDSSSSTDFRNKIAAVFQEFPCYESSIKNNIIISGKSNVCSDASLQKLCEKIGIDSIVEKFPLGLNEKVGIFSDFGRNLSGGEWQKIAIARAAYRKSASIMILDEPTSALDPKAEAKIYQDFAELVYGKTTLLITHRLGAIKVVDRIIVLSAGRIVEQGTHEELLAKDGLYKKMYQAQAKWYA